MTVYLVGAGPGDPGLLTVRGAELLARADVVVYDRLSVAALLDLAPPEAERISVGKAPGGHGVRQDEINVLLVDRGRTGETVVRLKGGDPFVFARGGEEAAALAAAGVEFEVVPGVTSAVAAPAYAGVPLTYRGLSTSFIVVTGHEDPWAATETDWDAVAAVGGTIVVLMGVATRGEIARRLIGAGLAAETPVVAVTWGTRPEQTTVRTDLAGLGAASVSSPATIVIGAVAGLDLAWFERRPLLGRRVVVTRPSGRSRELIGELRQTGADVLEAPAIEIEAPPDGGAAMVAASARASEYDWIVFTSATAVGPFLSLLPDVRDLGPAKVGAVGQATAAEVASWHVRAALVPESFVAEALVEAFPAGSGRVLLPQAEGARPVVADGLRAKGWQVDTVIAYRSSPAPLPAAVIEAISQADAIAFSSSSGVRALVGVAGVDHLPPVVACIGPITAATARECGLEVGAEAVSHDTQGLVAALIRALAPRR